MLSRVAALRSALARGGLAAVQHVVGVRPSVVLTSGSLTQTAVRCIATGTKGPSEDTRTAAQQGGSYPSRVAAGIANRERVTSSDSITSLKKRIRDTDAKLNKTTAELGQVREELGAVRDSIQSLLDQRACAAIASCFLQPGDQRGTLEELKTTVAALQLKVQQIEEATQQARDDTPTSQREASTEGSTTETPPDTAATEEGTPCHVVKTHASDFQATIDAIHETVRRHGGTLFTDIEASQVLKAGDIHLNVGGRTVILAPDALALPDLANTYLAHLLLRHMSALPRITMEDGRQLPFLDASRIFGTWLEDRVAVAQQEGKFIDELTDEERSKVSIRFYHDKLIKNRLLGDGSAGIMDAAKALEDVERFYTEIGGLLRTGEDKGSVKSVCVRSHREASLQVTLDQPTSSDSIREIFNDRVGGGTTLKTSPEHFHLAVDFLRRIRLSLPGSVVEPPHVPGALQPSLQVTLTSLQLCPSHVASPAQLSEVAAMAGKKVEALRSVYSSARDNHDYARFLQQVENAENLLLLTRKGPYGFAYLIDGTIPPVRTETVTVDRPVRVFSLCGHGFDKLTEFKTDGESAKVTVLGMEASNEKWKFRVNLKGRSLILGWHSSDVRWCRQSFHRDCVPEGYSGKRDEDRHAWLGGECEFKADVVEAITFV